MQKLIDNLSKKHIEEIINAIIASHSFTILGLDPHGTRVIQKLIDKIKDKQCKSDMCNMCGKCQ